jgi:Spy/CpxP family protein refolding chaperone
MTKTNPSEEPAMKKLLLACSLIGAMSAVHAQPAQPTPPDHPPHAKHERAFDPAEHAAHLQKTLQLSDDQTAKVKKILEDNAQQRKSLEDKYKPQFEAFRTDMKNLHDQAHSQINGVLTPKQQTALAELEKARNKMEWRHHEHGKEKNESASTK